MSAHGSETRYRQGCRCGDCRRAASAARKRRRSANLDATRTYNREQKRKYRAALADSDEAGS